MLNSFFIIRIRKLIVKLYNDAIYRFEFEKRTRMKEWIYYLKYFLNFLHHDTRNTRRLLLLEFYFIFCFFFKAKNRKIKISDVLIFDGITNRSKLFIILRARKNKIVNTMKVFTVFLHIFL